MVLIHSTEFSSTRTSLLIWEESTYLLPSPPPNLAFILFCGRMMVGEAFLAVDWVAYHKLLLPEMSFDLQFVILEKNPLSRKKNRTLRVSSDHRSNFLELSGNFHAPFFQNSLWGTPPPNWEVSHLADNMTPLLCTYLSQRLPSCDSCCTYQSHSREEDFLEGRGKVLVIFISLEPIKVGVC